MNRKKINAVLSLLTFIAMCMHMGYSSYAYLTFYYNPSLTKGFAIPFMVLVCLHAIIGMCSVFLLSDGTRLQNYPKQNKRILCQRMTAAFIFPLLLIHINMYSLLSDASSEEHYFIFFLLILSEVLFYCVVVVHAAVSFSRALITLGLIGSKKAEKITDRIVFTVCLVVLAVSLFAVIKGQIVMFILK